MSPVSTSFRPGRAVTEYLLRRHDAAVGERHGRTGLKLPALGAERDAQCVCGGNVESSGSRLLDKGVADCVAPMPDSEGPELVAVARQHRSRGELDHVHFVAQASEDPGQRAKQVIEPSWPVQRQWQLAAPEGERLQHSRQAEEVVGVEVREEDLVELDQADVRAEELPLRPLAAVEEQLLATAPHERGGRSAASGRHRAGRAEEDDVEVHAVKSRAVLRYGRTSTCPGTSTVPSSLFRPWISQTPSRGSEYPRDAIDQSVSCGCTT